MELVGPLAVAGAFAVFLYTAERSIKEIPISRPMPRSLRAIVAGCIAVVVGLALEGFAPPTPWRYSLMFCLFGTGLVISEYAWARRHGCERQGVGSPSR